MTGDEHWLEAERLLEAITYHGNLEEGDHGDVLRLAQAHAMLALVSAVLHGKPRESA